MISDWDYHSRVALERDPERQFPVLRIAGVARDASRGVEAVHVDLLVLSEELLDGPAAVLVVPCITAVEIAALPYDLVGFVRHHGVAPGIVDNASPVVGIWCLWISQLVNQKNQPTSS